MKFTSYLSPLFAFGFIFMTKHFDVVIEWLAGTGPVNFTFIHPYHALHDDQYLRCKFSAKKYE